MAGNVVGDQRSSVAAFDSYVRLHADRLVRTACLVTRDWEEARDAVQDALVSLYPRWSAVPSDRLDAYVYRTVVNACLIRLRRRRRLWPIADPGSMADAGALDPGVQVADADEAWRLCAGLPPVQRAAVVLRFYNDLSYADVAQALGCSEVTARSHVHRTITRLRARYSPEGRP
jgi:RNA polymerase sigma-70 factor (sigma-E family)